MEKSKMRTSTDVLLSSWASSTSHEMGLKKEDLNRITESIGSGTSTIQRKQLGIKQKLIEIEAISNSRTELRKRLSDLQICYAASEEEIRAAAPTTEILKKGLEELSLDKEKHHVELRNLQTNQIKWKNLIADEERCKELIVGWNESRFKTELKMLSESLLQYTNEEYVISGKDEASKRSKEIVSAVNDARRRWRLSLIDTDKLHLDRERQTNELNCVTQTLKSQKEKLENNHMELQTLELDCEKLQEEKYCEELKVKVAQDKLKWDEEHLRKVNDSIQRANEETATRIASQLVETEKVNTELSTFLKSDEVVNYEKDLSAYESALSNGNSLRKKCLDMQSMNSRLLRFLSDIERTTACHEKEVQAKAVSRELESRQQAVATSQKRDEMNIIRLLEQLQDIKLTTCIKSESNSRTEILDKELKGWCNLLSSSEKNKDGILGWENKKKVIAEEEVIRRDIEETEDMERSMLGDPTNNIGRGGSGVRSILGSKSKSASRPLELIENNLLRSNIDQRKRRIISLGHTSLSESLAHQKRPRKASDNSINDFLKERQLTNKIDSQSDISSLFHEKSARYQRLSAKKFDKRRSQSHGKLPFDAPKLSFDDL